MQLPGFPTVDTVEKLFAWAAVALDNKAYPAQTLSDSVRAASPISLSQGRITASEHFNQPYLRITADIPLDSDLLNTVPLYDATQEIVTSDTFPTALASTIEDGGASSSAPSLYALSFSDDCVFWTRGESMSQGLFGNVNFADVGGSEIALGAGSKNAVATMEGNVGWLYGIDTGPSAVLSLPSIQHFTVIACFALSEYASYIEIFNNGSDYLYLGTNPNIETQGFSVNFNNLTLDQALHVHHLSCDGTQCDLYLDGVLQQSAPYDSTSVPVDIDAILTDADDCVFLTDLVLCNRPLTAQEIAESYGAIATQRGLIV